MHLFIKERLKVSHIILIFGSVPEGLTKILPLLFKSFLTLIFNDSLHTPEPEPFYVLKFSSPESYSRLKKQTNIVVAAIDRDSANTGLKLINIDLFIILQCTFYCYRIRSHLDCI